MSRVRTEFQSKRIIDPVRRAEDKVARQAGFAIRARAIASIQEAPGRHAGAPAGSVAYSHLGLIRKFILYALDRKTRSVVVGPKALGKPGNQLEILEHGGTEVLSKTNRGGSIRRRVAIYAARPTMQPALDAEIQSGLLERLWANAVN